MIVKAVICRDGRYLLGKCKDEGPDAVRSVWDLPGGHVELGESPEEALVRELREELGVEGRVGELLYESLMAFPDGREEFQAYEAEVWGEFALTEHVRVGWVRPGEFNGYDIYPDFRTCLRAVTGG